MDESDGLWKIHCQHEFKISKVSKEDGDSWRETFKVNIRGFASVPWKALFKGKNSLFHGNAKEMIEFLKQI